MNQIGLNIGVLGLGDLSTRFYLKQLNAQYNAHFGGYATCPLVLLNTDFHQINSNLPDKYSKLKSLLLPYLNTLETLCISHLIIPNITLHHIWDLLQEEHSFSYTISHPIKLTLQALHRNKQQKAFLLATRYTMNSKTIKSYFSDKNITLINLSDKDKQFVDYIRKQVYLEKITSAEKKQFNDLVSDYIKLFPVILACTELSIIMTNHSKQIYDMSLLQVKDTLKCYF